MKQIDFLPADYRARTARRRGSAWRLLAAVAFLLLIAGVDVHMRLARQAALSELSKAEQPYLQAQQTRTLLATRQSELALAEEHARLLAYLGHRWPTTQLLAIPASTPPDAIQLTQIRLERGAALASENTSFATDSNVELATSEPHTRSAAAIALEELRRLSGTEVLVLSGYTTSPQAVQQFVTRLAQSPLVTTANLQAITKTGTGQLGGTEDSNSQFTVQVTIVDSLAVAMGPARTGLRSETGGTAQ